MSDFSDMMAALTNPDGTINVPPLTPQVYADASQAQAVPTPPPGGMGAQVQDALSAPYIPNVVIPVGRRDHIDDAVDDLVAQNTQPASQKDHIDAAVDDLVSGAAPSPVTPSAPATNTQKLEASTPAAVGMGALDPVLGIGQLAPRVLSKLLSIGGLVPNAASEAADRSAQLQDATFNSIDDSYRDARTATGKDGIDWGRLAGNIVSPANAVPGKLLSFLPEAATLGGRIAQGAASGAAFATTQPVNTGADSYGGQKAFQGATGFGLGAVAPAVGEAVGNIIKPELSKSAQLLQDEGVTLTPGMRNGSALRGAEDKMTSFPVVGDIIKSAQANSIQDLNTAVANRALNPIGESLPDGMNGRDAVQYVKKTLGDAYDNLLPNLQGQNDTQFDGAIKGIQNAAAAPGALPKQEQDAINGIFDREITSRISPGGGITGQSLKDMQTGLGNQIKNFSTASDPYQRQVLGALKEAQSQVRQMIGRTNPQAADQLSNIDKGYANYAIMRRAASSQGAEGGIFSPAQLAAAVKASDKTVGHGGYASGQAYMQDLSDAAKEILPQKSPNPSGTAGHLLLAGLLGEKGIGAIATSAAAGIPTYGLYNSAALKLGAKAAARPSSFGPLAQAIVKYSNPTAVAQRILR